ncbi:MAG TPA: hypothetical protein VIM31_02310 [Candidatus Microsaccharimonas sp.]|jgi:hypothetical protein
MMRPDVRPPVKLEVLKIDGTDKLDTPRRHFKRLKETNKGLVIFIIILIAIILIVGGLAAYMLLLHNNQALDTANPSNTQTPTTHQKLTAETLVAKAKDVAQGRVKETFLDTDGKPYNTFSAPPFKPSGYNFSVRPDVEYGFSSYGTKNVVATDLTAIQKILTDNGLVASVLDPGSDIGVYAAQYESTAIVCIISDQKPAKPSPTSTDYSMTIGCADTSAYLTNAATLRPYFIIYASQTKFDTTQTLMGAPTLKASKTDGYSIATVPIGGSQYGSVGGFAGLFYVTPDKTLHYFTGTQSELPCSKFSTDDLKKAYLGEQCYDEQTNNDTATVKL